MIQPDIIEFWKRSVTFLRGLTIPKIGLDYTKFYLVAYSSGAILQFLFFYLERVMVGSNTQYLILTPFSLSFLLASQQATGQYLEA